MYHKNTGLVKNSVMTTITDDVKQFELTKKIFINTCKKFNIPVPSVIPARQTDPCDFTSETEVRLNIPAAKPCSPSWHAYHVFGHYIANLHEIGDNATDEKSHWSDLVADAIASMLWRGYGIAAQETKVPKDKLKNILKNLSTETKRDILYFCIGIISLVVIFSVILYIVQVVW